MRVDVAFLPGDAEFGDRTCMVVDVLRATSVTATLFGRGVEEIYPVAGVAAARALKTCLAEQSQRGPVLLCGEENAFPPEGFDYGNSPHELAALDRLPATTAVLATTNGTPALLACADAPLVLAAAPLNAGACVRAALAAESDVLIVCSGRGGRFGDDDALAAGLFVAALVAAGGEPGDDARRARQLFSAQRHDLARALRATAHGSALVRSGFADDVDLCAQVDRFTVSAALDSAALPELGTVPVLRPLSSVSAR